MGEVIKKVKGGRFVGWYLRFVDVDGRRKQRASGQPTHAEAKRMLIEIEARIARGKLGVPEREPELAMMTIADLSERFLSEYDSPKIRNHDRWASKARTHLRPVLRQVGALSATQFTAAQAEKLRNTLVRSGAANTAAVRLSQISCVFAWACKQRIVTQNPFVGLRKPRKEARLEFLTVSEARRLLNATDEQAQSDLRSAVFSVAVRLGLLAGLRAGEVFGLRWRDCDLDRGVMTVNKSYRSVTKTGRPRTVPMTDELASVLRTWRNRCPSTKEGVICPLNPKKRNFDSAPWHQAYRAPSPAALYRVAGLRVPQAPWHCLRHSFASLFVQSGGSLPTLQKLLGHADIQMTMVYAHISDSFAASEIKRLKL